MEKDQVFERSKWATSDGIAQAWVGELIWNLLRGPRANVPLPPTLPNGMTDVATVCRQVILHGNIGGAVSHVYGDRLTTILSSQFYDRIESDRRRTDILLQDMQWLLGPTMYGKMVAVEGVAVRRIYLKPGDKTPNPRLIPSLTLWAPTLSVREEIAGVLKSGDYKAVGKDPNAYVFSKVTTGVAHTVKIKGLLWESSKSWSSDVERLIWDRGLAKGGTDAPIQFDLTDLFLMACRHFSVDTLCGGAAELLDLLTILECAGDNLDWSRVKEVKDQFAKPDWFWAACLAVVIAEQKTGRKVEMPQWVRSTVKEMSDSFYFGFVESRLNWANPDTRLVDFPRAYVKLARGT